MALTDIVSQESSSIFVNRTESDILDIVAQSMNSLRIPAGGVEAYFHAVAV